eukprot:2084526-Rhodomonas_salina.1
MSPPPGHQWSTVHSWQRPPTVPAPGVGWALRTDSVLCVCTGVEQERAWAAGGAGSTRCVMIHCAFCCLKC